MQKEILEKYPDGKVKIYAIWFSMIASDTRSGWKWTAGVLNDSRVVHMWDEKKVIGQWFAAQTKNWGNGDDVLEDNNVVWDTFFLYGADAEWKDTLANPISLGSTINKEQEKLKASISPLLLGNGK